MKKSLLLFFSALLIIGCKQNKSESSQENQEMANSEENSSSTEMATPTIDPISHATAVISWGDVIFYTDPVGGAELFSDKEKPDFILITDIHGDHMNAETLEAMNLNGVNIIAPEAVKNELPESLQQYVQVLNNGSSTELNSIKIEAIPMYNLPETEDSRHPKGRGNGYLLEKDGQRMYISGDTEDIPEMRQLENIDYALVCMNLPYTMSVEQAADAVLDFKPKQVYPYHYRGQDGLADVEKFKNLVAEENNDIEVVQLDWYPNRS
ncbi:MBL fold metallo-hydrolase [Salegentibacter sp. HM20]